MTKHLPTSPPVKAIYDYVQKMRRLQMKSSRQWREKGNIPMADYRSGMVGMCLDILDYIERHP